MTNTYVALDLETTGLNPMNDKIIEIGAIKIVNGIETERFETYVNPGIQINTRITEITGITDKDVAAAPDISSVIAEIIDFTEGYILLGHNIVFDYSFLKKSAADFGKKYRKSGIDTFKIAKKVLPELPSKSLEYLCNYFNIETKHHRAVADAISASHIYHKMCEISETDNEIMELTYRFPKQSPITEKQKKYLEALVKKHNLSDIKEIDAMTKSQASKMIDLILSEYGIRS